MNRTIPYLNTLSRTIPYLSTLTRTIPYLNTLQSAANQIRVSRNWSRQPIRIEYYVTRELAPLGCRLAIAYLNTWGLPPPPPPTWSAPSSTTDRIIYAQYARDLNLSDSFIHKFCIALDRGVGAKVDN